MKDTIKRLNEELTTRELEIIASEINSYDSRFEDLVAYNMEWDFSELLHGVSPNEVANMVHFGNYNPSHEYFIFNGYGNIDTLSERDYYEELEDRREDIITSLVEFHDNGKIDFSEYF